MVTEFGPNTAFEDTVKIFQDLMRDHEEEILKHLTTLDYGNADVAKAYTLLPNNQTIRTLDDEDKIRKPVHVPDMFADVIVALATQTTADDKTA